MSETWQEVAIRNRPMYEAALRQAETDLASAQKACRPLMVTIASFRSLLALDLPERAPVPDNLAVAADDDSK